MKNTLRMIPGMLLMAAAASPMAAQAAAPDALAKFGCTGCHGMDNKIVGPGFKEIAAKYKGNDAAKADLAKSIKGGSMGKWGPIPMPAQAALSDADVAAVVDWLVAGAQ